MNILLVKNSFIPPKNYGGTQRIVYWLAKTLDKLGHRVFLMAHGDSEIFKTSPSIHHIAYPEKDRHIEKHIPDFIDIVHFHQQPKVILQKKPCIITMHGNALHGERFLPNTVFLSRKHAECHGARHFVYNGVDPEDYIFSIAKSNYMLYMAMLNWRVKNAPTAMQLALDLKQPLKLAGGQLKSAWKIWSLKRLFNYFKQRPYIEEVGLVGGKVKVDLLTKASILFYIVNWQEPCAVAPQEAFLCGTPVIASSNGVLPEYIKDGENGYIVNTYKEALEVLKSHFSMPPERRAEMAKHCRDSAFTADTMAKSYLSLYEKVIKEKYLYPPRDAEKFSFSPGKVINISP